MTESQWIARLEVEKAVLESELPHYSLSISGGSACVEGWETTRSGRRFKLRLQVSRYYPDEMPALYVATPSVLPKHGSGTINAEGLSHSWHTRSNGPGGCVRLCHTKSDHWDASRTLVGVIVKGILWLEGYCAHLETGRPISDYFRP